MGHLLHLAAGPRNLRCIQQQGPRLTGRLTSDAVSSSQGNRRRRELHHQLVDARRRRELDITFTGKVEGDTMTGTAKLGNRGTGQLSGTRTGQ
jgi:hypothetical protein